MRLPFRLPKLTHLQKQIAWAVGATIVGGTAISLLTRKKQTTIADRLTEAHGPIPYLSTIRGMIDAKNTAERLDRMFQIINPSPSGSIDGSFVFVSDLAFRSIHVHQGWQALDLVAGSFYKDGKFTTDNLASHSTCQTIAAQVVGLGNAWEGWFYNQIYRYPSPNPVYAGNAIDPHADPEAFNNAVLAAIKQNIYDAMQSADLATTLTHFQQLFGKLFSSPLDVSGLGAANGLFLVGLQPLTRDALARFGRDMAAKSGKPLPTTSKDGKPLPEPLLSNLHASVGAGIAAHLIDAFESSDPKVNPCIRELTAGLVFEMFAATLGTVLTLALGPAISATALIIKIASTINKLADLSK